MHIKTVILLGNFFQLVCVMLLICQQRFLFTVFFTFLGVNVFYIYATDYIYFVYGFFNVFVNPAAFVSKVV